MIIKILLSYIFGYLRLSLEGYYIERFLNICNNKKIIIWNIKREKNIKVYFNIRIEDFKKVVSISKKIKCCVKIEKKKGIPFLVNRYKKRKIFASFIFIIALFIVISSNFIWNIEIKEEKGKEIEGIYEDVLEAGIKIGKLKSKINRKEIINKVCLKREDIAWMGIEIKGTNAIISIVKSDTKPNIINNNEYCSIVSNKKGVITKINSQNGTANVKVGDIVKEGTPLINGWVEGKYTGKRFVHARGEIEAKVWHTKFIEIPYKFTELRETGNKKDFYSFKINNFEINLSKRVSNFEIYDTIETENKYKLFSNFYLPFSVKKVTLKEKIKEHKTYDFEQAKKLGIEELEKKFKEEMNDNSKIVNKNINVDKDEKSAKIKVTYETLEEIGIKERIVF